MSARLVSLAILAFLISCGSGTVRSDDDSGSVAPAPAPDTEPSLVEADTTIPPAPVAQAPTIRPPTVTPDTAARPTPAGTLADVEIRRIGRWVSSNIKGSRRLVIRDNATWTRFWSELGAGVRPQVDFSRDLVIAVASGERTTGGHDIVVQRVQRTGGELRIEVLETRPGQGCMTTAALTQPVDVVMVPSEGVTGWSFIDRAATGQC